MFPLSPILTRTQYGPGTHKYAGRSQWFGMEPRDCHRLPVTATKAERLTKHRNKMANKRAMRRAHRSN